MNGENETEIEDNGASSKRKTIKKISILIVGSFGGAGLTFLTQIILARSLTKAEYGVWASSLALATMLAPFIAFGLSKYWLKVFGEEGWTAVRWFPASFRFVTLSMLLVFTVTTIWAWAGPHGTETSLVMTFLLVHMLSISAIELNSAKCQLEGRIWGLALWQFTPHLIRCISILFILVWLGSDTNVVYVSIAYSITALVIVAMSFYQLVQMRNTGIKLVGHGENQYTASDEKKVPRASSILYKAWPFGLAGFFYYIYFQSDLVMLKYISGDESAGLYNVAFVILAAVYLVPSVIYQKFLIPKMHRWAYHRPDNIRKVYRDGNIAMLAMGVAAMIAVLLAAPNFISSVFGPQYSGSVPIIMILSLAIPLRFVANSVGATLVTKNFMKTKVKLMAYAALFNLAINLILIPEIGAVGAAISTVATEALLLMMYFFVNSKHYFQDIQKETV